MFLTSHVHISTLKRVFQDIFANLFQLSPIGHFCSHAKQIHPNKIFQLELQQFVIGAMVQMIKRSVPAPEVRDSIPVCNKFSLATTGNFRNG